MKKLTVLGCALLTVAAVFADLTHAVVTTEGAPGEDSGDTTLYTAYLCTVEAAAQYFGGNSDYAGITTYLKDEANFQSGVSQVSSGGIAFDTYEYDLGEYSYIKDFQPGSLSSGSYIALALFTGGDVDYFRVFESVLSGDGALVFDPAAGIGSAGAWTPVGTPSPTPEPTSALLMLIGAAGLALRRKRA